MGNVSFWELSYLTRAVHIRSNFCVALAALCISSHKQAKDVSFVSRGDTCEKSSLASFSTAPRSSTRFSSSLGKFRSTATLFSFSLQFEAIKPSATATSHHGTVHYFAKRWYWETFESQISWKLSRTHQEWSAAVARGFCPRRSK